MRENIYNKEQLQVKLCDGHRIHTVFSGDCPICSYGTTSYVDGCMGLVYTHQLERKKHTDQIRLKGKCHRVLMSFQNLQLFYLLAETLKY